MRRVTRVRLTENGRISVDFADFEPSPPRDHDVVIEVAAAGLNAADLKRQASAQSRAESLPGLECAGIITAVGAAVDEAEIDTRVMALVRGGSLGPSVTVPFSATARVPEGMSLTQAAAIPEAACTILANIPTRQHDSGGWALFHGASGGVGTLAVQLLRAHGYQVSATAGSDDACESLRELGVICPVNYRSRSWVDVVRRATAPQGAALILDPIGGRNIELDLRIVAQRGRIVCLGAADSSDPRLDVDGLISKEVVLAGSSLSLRSDDERGALMHLVATEVLGHIAAGQVRPVVHAAKPFSEIEEAYAITRQAGRFGKVVVVFDGTAGS